MCSNASSLNFEDKGATVSQLMHLLMQIFLMILSAHHVVFAALCDVLE